METLWNRMSVLAALRGAGWPIGLGWLAHVPSASRAP
jgi:hypothetical protein